MRLRLRQIITGGWWTHRPPSEMLLPWMKWSLTSTCRKVGDCAVALKDCEKKTFQLALSSLVALDVPYQTMPTEPGVGPVSSHGMRLDAVPGPFETRTGWLHVTPRSVECTRKMSFPFE